MQRKDQRLACAVRRVLRAEAEREVGTEHVPPRVFHHKEAGAAALDEAKKGGT